MLIGMYVIIALAFVSLTVIHGGGLFANGKQYVFPDSAGGTSGILSALLHRQ